jgi:CRISPR-associated protein Csc3
LAEVDIQRIALLLGMEEPSIFRDYLEQVANQGLLEYRRFLQWGNKQGESLYTHVLNGVQVLETLRPYLILTDVETQVLFVAFTIHDLNKTLAQGQEKAFGKLATQDNVGIEIERLRLNDFLPDWRDYLQDITSLIRGHSGHYSSGAERLIVRREPVYKLGLERINALLHLMRAADVVDLSHTLIERSHKSDFLGHLNAYLADNGRATQFAFVTHRLTEQRGILTNVIHNAIVTYLQERYDLIPLLYYPDGVAYLIEKGQKTAIDAEDIARMGTQIADTISGMTTGKFEQFINSTGQGIKVDPKCLELGIPFRQIWRAIHKLVQRRNPNPIDMDSKVREWAERGFDKSKKAYPAEADRVRSALNSDALLISGEPDRLRLVELIRAYYIFLNRHFAKAVPDAWERIYRLLELPESEWPYYTYFDALWARAYVLSRDLALGEEEIYLRIEQDGEEVTGGGQSEDDAKTALFTHYLTLYAIFDVTSRAEVNFGDHLAHYAANQHQQCVYCSGPFATDKWMAADVRSDITVQTFSNRLRGGSGEPKKHICAVCQIQFLLEKLNYPEVRSEKTLYLHLYPYSFLTKPFIEGLNATFKRIVSEDTAVQALNMDVIPAIDEYLNNRTATPTFRSRTKQNRPQPFGIYLPQYAETVGNLLIFPINPGGKNDTERFLFALWNALLLQRHFGVKVLMSDMAVPPLASFWCKTAKVTAMTAHRAN